MSQYSDEKKSFPWITMLPTSRFQVHWRAESHLT